MANNRDLILDSFIDSVLDKTSEIQGIAAKLSSTGTEGGRELYMRAAEIEFEIDILRELRSSGAV